MPCGNASDDWGVGLAAIPSADHDGAELVGAQRPRTGLCEHPEGRVCRVSVAVIGANRDEPERRPEFLVQPRALVARAVVRHLHDVGPEMRMLAQQVPLGFLPEVAERRKRQAR